MKKADLLIVLRYFFPGSEMATASAFFRIESGIDLLQTKEAANHQAGADQQHQRERDFRDDERAANA